MQIEILRAVWDLGHQAYLELSRISSEFNYVQKNRERIKKYFI